MGHAQKGGGGSASPYLVGQEDWGPRRWVHLTGGGTRKKTRVRLDAQNASDWTVSTGQCSTQPSAVLGTTSLGGAEDLRFSQLSLEAFGQNR